MSRFSPSLSPSDVKNGWKQLQHTFLDQSNTFCFMNFGVKLSEELRSRWVDRAASFNVESGVLRHNIKFLSILRISFEYLSVYCIRVGTQKIQIA
jgi:hypothetical protein